MTRISTNHFYQQAATHLGQGMKSLEQSAHEMSAGVKLSSSAQDPVAYARLENLKNHHQAQEQYLRNTDHVDAKLSHESTVLSEVTRVLQRISTLAIQANSPLMQQSNRSSIRVELQQNLYQLSRYANTQYEGEYLFSGHRAHQAAVVEQGQDQYVYQGDTGTQRMQIGEETYVTGNHDGWEVFFDINSTKINANRFIGQATATSSRSVPPLVDQGSLVGLQDNALVLNQVAIQHSVNDGVSVTDAAASAVAIANAINASIIQHGVFAIAQPNVVDLGAVTPGVLAANNLVINGVSVVDNNGTTAQGLVDAINQANVPGVTAALNGGAVSLTAVDGRNIGVSTNGAALNAATFANFDLRNGVRQQVQRASLTLSSPHEFSIAGSNPAVLGLSAGRYSPTANVGNGLISDLKLIGEPPLAHLNQNKQVYRVVFNGPTTYSLYSAAQPNVPLPGFKEVAYTAGTPIQFEANGATEAPSHSLALTLNGTPQAGDVFFVELNKQRKQDIFSTIHDLIKTLEAGPDSNHPNAMSYHIGVEIADLNLGLEHIAFKNAEVGTRQKCVEIQVKDNKAAQVLTQQIMSQVQDLDYAQAVAAFSNQKLIFEAASQCFLRMQPLLSSLISYLGK